jgi:hypothetical protein
MELCPEYMLVPPVVKLDIYGYEKRQLRLDAGSRTRLQV